MSPKIPGSVVRNLRSTGEAVKLATGRQLSAIVILVGAVLMSAALCSANALGQSEAETWRCQNHRGYAFNESTPILVVATRFTDGSGTVKVAGVTQMAAFSIDGFDRRWDFGPALKSGHTRYAFVIQPNGNAGYYDFTYADEKGKTSARQSYLCKSS